MTAFARVIAPGIQTTVQDLPGRTGYWKVGVPPSGAWDRTSFALANAAVGNEPGAAGLEAVLRGPKLRFTTETTVAIAGAASAATLDGVPVPLGRPVVATEGAVLDLGPFRGPGLRAYLAVRGGIAVDTVLGSASTFLLGKFGGFDGRALRAGDELAAVSGPIGSPADVSERLPVLANEWEIAVIPGPHGAPEHLTDEGAAEFFAATWRVDHRADRTGIRLVGPTPRWARADGGDAGLHPSNVHDNGYPIGAVMIAGDTPVIVGPDGPSLGGFVVAAVVRDEDLWKLGQLRPGDQVRLVATDRPAPLAVVGATEGAPELVVRAAGDRHLLVEVGPPALDLDVRLRVHLLATALLDTVDGIAECVEGVRSVLFAVNPERLNLQALAGYVVDAWRDLPDPRDVAIEAREVTMPIAFDDASVHEAMSRYASGVRPDAPWCPDNIEFIRRINGLPERGNVFETVARAAYLVIGLGDVYLGAPVAVPLDPADRLVTTKYDPPRTWTPENAVGIGGVYLCVYGMEGPGGYQLVGRTVPIWRRPGPDCPGPDHPGAPVPWLLRAFDVLRFQAVRPDELVELREAIASGRAEIPSRPITLTYRDIVSETVSAAASHFTASRSAAYVAERERWQQQLSEVLT